MKKTFFVWSVAMMMLQVFSVGFVSCSGNDDEEDDIKVENPEDNLPEKVRAFVGYWRNIDTDDRSLCTFLFLPNGTCKRFDNFMSNLIDKGYWTFDEKTNILATTTGDYKSHPWQWQITLSNDEAWVGILLGSNKSDAYRKNDRSFVDGFLQDTRWQCGDTARIIFPSEQTNWRYYFYKSDISALDKFAYTKNSYIGISSKEEFVAKKRDLTGELTVRGESWEKEISFTIKNWASKNPTLKFEGSKQVYSLENE